MHLERLGLIALQVNPDPVLIATEGALWGSICDHGFLHEAVIVSDDAGQFAVGRHALCRVHAERLVHKLDTFTDLHRAAQQRMRSLIWWFHADLKAYQCAPTSRRQNELRARFDRIFRRHTGFASLDRLLARLHANKPEPLMTLDRPDIPLHSNRSERDLRAHVTKRKISGGTHSDPGRNCRNAFLGLMQTCTKLGITSYDYLGDRLAVPGHLNVPRLPDLIRCRRQPP
ncbi:MAG: transposase [Rhodospirillales bacterium]|nr:transposase [Rhodospirillales bacterium]